MVNDEVNNKAINIEIKVAQYSAKAILKAMKKIMEDAALIHEAAIGRIASNQLIKLMTLGLTESEAEDTILEGFLK